MCSSGSWVPKQEGNGHGSGNEYVWHPPAPPVTHRAHHHRPPPHIELQQVESLRLRLTFQHSVVAWIQIPRMYPHRPPLISRVVYHNQQQHKPHQGIQSILVHEAPPTKAFNSGDEVPDNNNNNNIQSSPGSIHCANTVVYHSWSPVQRLGDLLDFVIAVFQKQHNEMMGNDPKNMNSINDVSLTYSSSSPSSNSSWNNSRRSSSSSITSATTASTSGYRTSSSSIMFPGWQQPQSMTIDGSHNHNNSKADMSFFLTPNRFDVGYNRAVPPVTMDVDNNGIPQQVSMSMDLL